MTISLPSSLIACFLLAAAAFGRKLDPRIVRGVVIAISIAATIVFFLRKS
jgi:hypothetical protein